MSASIVMRKSTRLARAAAVAIVALVATTSVGLAAGADHSGGNGGFDGNSGSHLSDQGFGTRDGDKGLDRTRDRMSKKGLAHSNATHHHYKHKHRHDIAKR